MSFLHRYIPVGLLEMSDLSRLPLSLLSPYLFLSKYSPQIQMNQRPAKYFGRNDLETMMASPDSREWVKLSEMILGKVPENFKFVPKHKSNAYEDDDSAAQG
jgi:tRNA-dihydrouridine synthase 3